MYSIIQVPMALDKYSIRLNKGSTQAVQITKPNHIELFFLIYVKTETNV